MPLRRQLLLVIALVVGCAATPASVDLAQKQCCGPPPPPTLTKVTAPIPLIASPQAQAVTIQGTSFTAPLSLFLSNPAGTQIGTTLGATNSTQVTFTAIFNVAGQWTLQVKSAKRGWSNVLTITVITPTPVTIPLTMTCPQDIAATTTGTSATVIIPQAQVAGGTAPYTVVISPPSGSSFGLTTTNVLQTATDSGSPQQTLPQTPCPAVTVTQIPPPPTPPPGGVSLTADVQLTGSASYTLTGTSGAHIPLLCNGFRFIVPDQSWTGTFSLQYVDLSGCGSAAAEMFGATTAGTGAYLNGATFFLDHVTLDTSGGIDLYTVNGAAVTVTNSVWKATNVWPASYTDQANTGIFFERGTSTTTKLFQGNQLLVSWASFNSPNWVIGTGNCTVGNAALSNLIIGHRAGLAVAGAGTVAACNYTHSIEDVTPTVPFWADVENLRGPGFGASVHDNVFNFGQWMTTGIDGSLTNNVYANGGGHDYWRIGHGGTAANNILFGATQFNNGQRYGSGVSYTAIPGEAAAIDLIQAGNQFSVLHNTIDVSGDVEHGCVRVVNGATLTAYQSNVCGGVTLGTSNSGTTVAALMPDPSEGLLSPAPNRVTAADHNDTTFLNTGSPLVYDITTAGGQPCAAGGAGASDLGTCNGAGAAPQFRGPLPIAGPYDLAGDRSAAFPFNDSDILNGTYTVADILAWARWVYAPGAGSPLLGAGADGKDLGAVDTTTLPGSAPAIVTTNKRPVAIAGPSFTTGSSQFGGDVDHAELIGWGADDGLPSGTLTFTWSQVSGPGTATIDHTDRNAATASLPTCGVYVFQLAVSDGTLTSTSQATITKTCSGSAVHPLIWLTPTRLTALKAKVSGNDPDWLAFKAQADGFVADSIPAYDPSACGSNQICYAFEGLGWYDALYTLGLAYQVTGTTSYATQGIALMKVINAAGVTPETVDSGFPSRSAAASLALAYDWFYPALDPATKTATITTLNAYYDWAKANAFDFQPACNPLGNYCGGHLLGFGLAGIATTGDNPRASEISTFISNLWTANLVPAFTTGGLFQGGYPYEGYTYGINHFVRLLQYADAVKTSGGGDLESALIAPISHSLAYSEKPNRWQFPDEADYAGNCVGIPDPTILFMLATMGPSVPDAAYAQWIYTHLASNPCGQVASAGGRFQWFTATATATNPNTLPLAWYSPSDEHLFTRSDWTDNAIWTSFRMLNAAPATHQLRGAGNIEIQRGSDYLLVNGGQWKGSTGVTGDPQAFDDASWRANTAAIATTWSSAYTGGQGWWGTNHTLTQTVTSTYADICADLSSAYAASSGSATGGPAPNLKAFNRCAVSLLNGDVVIGDHLVLTTPTDLHSENYHVNPAVVPVVSGQTVTAGAGGSSLRITIVTPASLTFSVHDDPVSTTDLTRATYRIEAADSSGATTLDIITVLSAYATGTTPSTITSLGGLSVQVGSKTVTFGAGMTSVTVF